MSLLFSRWGYFYVLFLKSGLVSSDFCFFIIGKYARIQLPIICNIMLSSYEKNMGGCYENSESTEFKKQ